MGTGRAWLVVSGRDGGQGVPVRLPRAFAVTPFLRAWAEDCVARGGTEGTVEMWIQWGKRGEEGIGRAQ